MPPIRADPRHGQDPILDDNLGMAVGEGEPILVVVEFVRAGWIAQRGAWI